MTETKYRTAPEKILAFLDADPALIEHYDPAEIETLSIASIKERLAGLGVTSAVPVELQKAILDLAPSPAADVLSFLATEDALRLETQNLKKRPLAEVVADLRSQGVNYRVGVAEIVALARRHSASSPPDEARPAAWTSRAMTFDWRKIVKRIITPFAAAALVATAAAAASVVLYVEVRKDRAMIVDQRNVIAEQRHVIGSLRTTLMQKDIMHSSGTAQGREAAGAHLEYGAMDIAFRNRNPPSWFEDGMHLHNGTMIDRAVMGANGMPAFPDNGVRLNIFEVGTKDGPTIDGLVEDFQFPAGRPAYLWLDRSNGDRRRLMRSRARMAMALQTHGAATLCGDFPPERSMLRVQTDARGPVRGAFNDQKADERWLIDP